MCGDCAQKQDKCATCRVEIGGLIKADLLEAFLTKMTFKCDHCTDYLSFDEVRAGKHEGDHWLEQNFEKDES